MLIPHYIFILFFGHISQLRPFTKDFYGRIYTYKNNLLIEESTFNNSSSIINLTDKIEFIYNEEDILVEVRYIYDGKWKKSHKYEYTRNK